MHSTNIFVLATQYFINEIFPLFKITTRTEGKFIDLFFDFKTKNGLILENRRNRINKYVKQNNLVCCMNKIYITFHFWKDVPFWTNIVWCELEGIDQPTRIDIQQPWRLRRRQEQQQQWSSSNNRISADCSNISNRNNQQNFKYRFVQV